MHAVGGEGEGGEEDQQEQRDPAEELDVGHRRPAQDAAGRQPAERQQGTDDHRQRHGDGRRLEGLDEPAQEEAKHRPPGERLPLRRVQLALVGQPQHGDCYDAGDHHARNDGPDERSAPPLRPEGICEERRGHRLMATFRSMSSTTHPDGRARSR